MRKILIPYVLVSATGLLTACCSTQTGCSTGYVSTVVTTMPVVTRTRVITVSPVVTVPVVAPNTASCCPTCNRCGSAYGYDSGYYGYGTNDVSWY